MVAGVTWPSTLPPGTMVQWDVASAGEDQEERLGQASPCYSVSLLVYFPLQQKQCLLL
jgi:hypothetical protein